MAHARKAQCSHDLYQRTAVKEFAEEAYLDYGDIDEGVVRQWREKLDDERKGRKLTVVENGFQ